MDLAFDEEYLKMPEARRSLKKVLKLINKYGMPDSDAPYIGSLIMKYKSGSKNELKEYTYPIYTNNTNNIDIIDELLKNTDNDSRGYIYNSGEEYYDSFVKKAGVAALVNLNTGETKILDKTAFRDLLPKAASITNPGFIQNRQYVMYGNFDYAMLVNFDNGTVSEIYFRENAVSNQELKTVFNNLD